MLGPDRCSLLVHVPPVVGQHGMAYIDLMELLLDKMELLQVVEADFPQGFTLQTVTGVAPVRHVTPCTLGAMN
jgi:hypothetical protein